MNATYEVRNTLGQSLGIFGEYSDAMECFLAYPDSYSITKTAKGMTWIMYTRKNYEEYLEAKARYSHV